MAIRFSTGALLIMCTFAGCGGSESKARYAPATAWEESTDEALAETSSDENPNLASTSEELPAAANADSESGPTSPESATEEAESVAAGDVKPAEPMREETLAASEKPAQSSEDEAEQADKEEDTTAKNAESAQPKMAAEQAVSVTNDGKGQEAEKQQSTATKTGDQKYPAGYYEMPKWNVEGPEHSIRVSYDDLDLMKLMDLDPVPEGVGPELPSRITSLDGKRIRLRGFMMPSFVPDGLKGFVLARDNEICCFGRSPKIYDIIPVELREGVTTRYIEGRPFDVVGVMHVDPDIELFQMFYMDDAIVIE